MWDNAYASNDSLSNNQHIHIIMEQKLISTQWSTKSQGHLIFNVDQSRTMGDKCSENQNRAECAAEAINLCCNDIILANQNGFDVYNRAFIQAIGYGGQGGDSVKKLFEGTLPELANNPLRMKTIKQNIADGDRGMYGVEKEMAIFIDPVWRGCTVMGEAFRMAYDEIVMRGADHVILINISDGGPWSYEREFKEIDYAKEQARRIMNLNIPDGHPKILNIHIGSGHPQYICPGPETRLVGRQANFLWEISSELTDADRAVARKFGMNLPAHARGFISNSDALTLLRFIQFGSSAAKPDRMSA
jgi:hypothetical protein